MSYKLKKLYIKEKKFSLACLFLPFDVYLTFD